MTPPIERFAAVARRCRKAQAAFFDGRRSKDRDELLRVSLEAEAHLDASVTWAVTHPEQAGRELVLLARLVGGMREAQRVYFQGMHSADRQELYQVARAYERRVDQRLKECDWREPIPTLFGEGGGR